MNWKFFPNCAGHLKCVVSNIFFFLCNNLEIFYFRLHSVFPEDKVCFVMWCGVSGDGPDIAMTWNENKQAIIGDVLMLNLTDVKVQDCFLYLKSALIYTMRLWVYKHWILVKQQRESTSHCIEFYVQGRFWCEVWFNTLLTERFWK